MLEDLFPEALDCEVRAAADAPPTECRLDVSAPVPCSSPRLAPPGSRMSLMCSALADPKVGPTPGPYRFFAVPYRVGRRADAHPLVQARD